MSLLSRANRLNRIRQKVLSGTARRLSRVLIKIQPAEFGREALLSKAELKRNLRQHQVRGFPRRCICDAVDVTRNTEKAYRLLSARPGKIRLHRYKLACIFLTALEPVLDIQLFFFKAGP